MNEIKIPKCKQVWVRWDLWECVSAGMYEPAMCCRSDFELFKLEYSKFLADSQKFEYSANEMVWAWPLSCLNFLTNENINRIAWIGQASACYQLGLSSAFKSGFWLLSESKQTEANGIAFNILRKWVVKHNEHSTEDRSIRKDVDRQMLLGWDQ